MSMIGNFLLFEEDVIEKIQKGELSSADVIFEALENSEDNQNKDKILDIDKAWHAIHFTLTGELDEGDEDNILGQIMFSDTFLTEEEITYGPAVLIDKVSVAIISKKLCSITKQEFRDKFDTGKMVVAGVYSAVNGEDDNEFFEYVYYYFKQLQAFFSMANNHNNSLIYCLM